MQQPRLGLDVRGEAAELHDHLPVELQRRDDVSIGELEPRFGRDRQRVEQRLRALEADVLAAYPHRTAQRRVQLFEVYHSLPSRQSR